MAKGRVLIVDDEPAIRWILREALHSWGYEAIEAEDGAQTLANLTDSRVAAVLLDINLPDSSGLDLLREIKRRWPQVAVIMVTAEAFYDAAVSALRGGADDFIGKPIHLDELQFALNQAIDTVDQERKLAAADKPRVLMLSDSADRIPNMLSILNPDEAEITGVVYPEEWEYVAGARHDLALVDVGPELLEPTLRTLRTSSGHAEIPLLVEKSRVADAIQIAGVMPKYRAMPCGRDEMIRLARRRLDSITRRGQALGLF